MIIHIKKSRKQPKNWHVQAKSSQVGTWLRLFKSFLVPAFEISSFFGAFASHASCPVKIEKAYSVVRLKCGTAKLRFASLNFSDRLWGMQSSLQSHPSEENQTKETWHSNDTCYEVWSKGKVEEKNKPERIWSQIDRTSMQESPHNHLRHPCHPGKSHRQTNGKVHAPAPHAVATTICSIYSFFFTKCVLSVLPRWVVKRETGSFALRIYTKKI